MEKLKTRGEVKIEVNVVKATSTITLHANSSFVKIDHDNVVVQTADGDEELLVKGHKVDEEKEFYKLELWSPVEAGQRLLLILPFTGVIRDGRIGPVLPNGTDISGNRSNHHGFYVSTDGDWGLMGLTKFGQNGARQAFPFLR